MKTTQSIAAVVLAASAVLSGCAGNVPSQVQTSPYTSSQPESSTYGTIDSIQVTRTDANPSGAGAVAGGLVGALLGNQVGSGGGRTAATVAGAVGGAVVGNQIERSRNAPQDAYQISVRLDNGDYRTVVQDNVNELRVGNRVRVVDGRVYRY